MNGKRRLRVLLADDHPLFRDGLSTALRLHDDELDIVGEARDGKEAIRMAIELRPDIVVMDVNLGEMSGIAATREILRSNPGIHVLFLTISDDDATVVDAMKAGARGYILKGSDKDDIRRAIAVVSRGEAIFGGPIARRLAAYFEEAATSPKKPSLEQAFPALTEREQDILELICSGLSNEDIARSIRVSIKTVRNHVSNVLNKLQVEDRAQAIALVRSSGEGGAKR